MGEGDRKREREKGKRVSGAQVEIGKRLEGSPVPNISASSHCC